MCQHGVTPELILRNEGFLSVTSSIAEYFFTGGNPEKIREHLRKTYNSENKNLQLTEGFFFSGITYRDNIVGIPFSRITIFRDEKNVPLPQLDLEDMPFMIKIWEKNKTLDVRGSSDGKRKGYGNFIVQVEYHHDVIDRSFFNKLKGAIKSLKEDREIESGEKRERQRGKVVDLRGMKRFKDKEIIMVSDLHGNLENFKRILRDDGLEMKLEKEEAILVIVGDAICPAEQAMMGHDGLPYPKTKIPLTKTEKIDRLGEMEESFKVMKRIFELKSKFPSNVYYLMGNHDNPYFFKTSKPISQNACFQSYLLLRCGKECRQKYIEFLNMSPILFIADGIVVTHGGPIKGKVLRDLRKKGSDLVEVLKEEELDLKDMDYDKDQPYSNAVSQLAVSMHRLYNQREWLKYSASDVKAFIDAIGMPQNVQKTYFVVGHDHDFNRPEHDDTETGKVYEESGFWARTYGPSLPNHYIIFSGGAESSGYAIFKNSDIGFRAIR
jgi:hypothetical protein